MDIFIYASKILVSIEESYTIYNTRCITRETCT